MSIYDKTNKSVSDAVKSILETKTKSEEILQEYESKGGKYVNKGKYGTAYEKGEIHDRRDDVAPDKRGPQATNKITTTTPGHSDVAARFAAIQARGAPGTKHIKGKSQSGSPESREESVDNTNKLSFSELVSTYYTDGMNSLSESLVLVEEPTNQEFQDELKDQYDKFNGKKKGANVAAPSTVGTKEIKEEVELNEVNKLTDEEMKKREEIVKGMKKNLSSFKSRYGERAKGVMYATATKMANK